MEKGNTERTKLLQLFENKITRDITLDKKDFLVRSEKISKGIYLIKSGIVKHILSRNGKSFTIDYNGDGSLQGVELLFKAASPFSVVALTKVEAKFIPAESITQTISSEYASLEILLWCCQSKTRSLTRKLSIVHSLDASKQIALGILEISKLNGFDHTGSIARKELSNFAGCSVEYTFRTLASWQKDGIITISGKNILIKNRKALNNLVE